MKITNQPPTDSASALERARENRPSERVNDKSRKSVSEAQARSASSVEISENARLLQKAAEAVHQAEPGVGSERLAQLKDSVRSGRYEVEADKLAERILEEHLLTNFGKNNL